MILYTNGGSHTAAAEAVNAYAFADDDHKYAMQHKRPHPDNLHVAWSTSIAATLKMSHHTQAESASTNERIIKTTKEWIEQSKDTVPPEDALMIIQWCKWGNDATEDYDAQTEISFQEIFDFHIYLLDAGYNHIFFNGNDTFFTIPEAARYDFGSSYIDPYLPEGSFDGWLQLNGHDTVITSNSFYGAGAHAAWARRILKFILENKIV